MLKDLFLRRNQNVLTGFLIGLAVIAVVALAYVGWAHRWLGPNQGDRKEFKNEAIASAVMDGNMLQMDTLDGARFRVSPLHAQVQVKADFEQNGTYADISSRYCGLDSLGCAGSFSGWREAESATIYVRTPDQKKQWDKKLNIARSELIEMRTPRDVVLR